MKILGFIFLGLSLFVLGIVSAELGWFDWAVNWFKGLIK